MGICLKSPVKETTANQYIHSPGLVFARCLQDRMADPYVRMATAFLYNPRYKSPVRMTETLETVVTGDAIDIPRKMREMLHIQEGDRIRWTYEGDRLVAQVIKKRKGSLTSLIGKFSGEPTDSVKTHNLSGAR